jgi:hypothetical protein
VDVADEYKGRQKKKKLPVQAASIIPKKGNAVYAG